MYRYFNIGYYCYYLPKNPVQKKPPSDYFRVIYHLPYIESDIDQFVFELKQDELTIEYEVVNGVAPALNLIEDYTVNEISKIDLLPFNLKCDCFRYFTYNNEMIDGGYAYFIIIYEDMIIIDYMTR